MQLLDTLRFNRNIYGYPEETNISIYIEWVRGTQFFVVHPHHNDTDQPWDAQRYGHYMVNHETVAKFMCAFRDSWKIGSSVELNSDGEIWTRDQAYDIMYAEEDSEYTYRVTVREKSYRLFPELYVVGSLKDDAEHPALRAVRGATYLRAMLFPQEQATMMALGLSCIGVETMMSETIRKLFHNPEIIIQRALKTHLMNGIILEDHWENISQISFVGHNYVVQFNGDFTDATIVKK